MPPYGQETDEEVRQKAQNPLTKYFGGKQQPAPQPVPQPAPQQAPRPQPAPTNVGGGANRAPQPTGFTNFNRVASANRDVSTREAAKYSQQATNNANQAKSSLDALRARFGGEMAKATVSGPKIEQVAYAGPDEDGLVGGFEGKTYDKLGGDLTPEQLLANAQQTYKGPGGLGDVDGSEELYAQTLAAQQNLDALGSPEGVQALVGGPHSKFSGALIGNAGRKDFDALRARFNPEDDIQKAETEAAGQAAAAKDLSKKSAGEWKQLGETTKKTQEDEAAAAKKRKEDSDAWTATHKHDVELDAAFEEAMKSNAGDLMNSNFESFNDVMNPITQIAHTTGNRDPVQDYGTGLHGANASGGAHGRKIWWKPEHKAVYKQMDQKQWDELNKLPQAAQARWLDTRMDEVARGAPHAPFDSTKDIGKNAFYGWKL